MSPELATSLSLVPPGKPMFISFAKKLAILAIDT